jgi:hypothetical protein
MVSNDDRLPMDSNDHGHPMIPDDDRRAMITNHWLAGGDRHRVGGTPRPADEAHSISGGLSPNHEVIANST